MSNTASQSHELAAKLQENPDYRVLKRLDVPDAYHNRDGSEVHRGLYVDVETTSLDTVKAKVIELGAVPFEFSRDGRIFHVLKDQVISQLNDPGEPIPSEITKITGIDDEMVRGQVIDPGVVERAVAEANLIIAHNAGFDRPIMERHWPVFGTKSWACSYNDIPWLDEGIRTGKLNYLAFQYGFFFDGHRAIEDCYAGIHILAQELSSSRRLTLSALLESARKNTIRIRAVGAPFDEKDKLKARGYRWNNGDDGKPKAWWTDVDEDRRDDELAWLSEAVFGRAINLPTETVTAQTRYSARI